MKKKLLVSLLALMVVTACKKKDTVDTSDTDQRMIELKLTYAKMAFAVYNDAYLSAVELKTALYNFVDNPSDQSLTAAKQSWLAAREIYGQTEIFRFVDGPIDNTFDGPEALINSWPMDEAYVDYVSDNPSAGIINNPSQYPTISVTTIVQANELGGETNISSGYHAIEFMLWGQDLSATTAGSRPYTDFVIGGTAANQDRRGAYLKALADILVMALEQVKTDWDPAISGSYYYTFTQMSNATALRKMFNALRVLSGVELAGERIYVAYENEDQEDEHSCFSDNTHRDIYLNALAIENLYKGNYSSPFGNSVEGYALEDFSKALDNTKNQVVIDRFSTTMSLIGQLYTPFDQAIVLTNERPKVLEVVHSLQQQKKDLEQVAALYAITF